MKPALGPWSHRCSVTSSSPLGDVSDTMWQMGSKAMHGAVQAHESFPERQPLLGISHCRNALFLPLALEFCFLLHVARNMSGNVDAHTWKKNESCKWKIKS